MTQKYPAQIAAAVAEIAIPRGSRLWRRGEAWDAAVYEGTLASASWPTPTRSR
ncbi:MAG: hypothetical protein ACK5SX_10250 [Sandaracinobacter sp.]